MYPKAGWRKDLKSKEKAMKRGNWYKGGKREDNLMGVKAGMVKKPFQKARRKQKSKIKSASTVIFVPSTKGSVLLKSLKDDEVRMSEVTRFRIRY